MRDVIILLGMLACLFGPTALFTLFGYKALEELGRRPSLSGGVMIAFVTKFTVFAVILIGALIGLLKAFT